MFCMISFALGLVPFSPIDYATTAAEKTQAEGVLVVADSSEGGVDSFARKSIEGGGHDGAILASLADPAICFRGAAALPPAIAAGIS